MNYHLLDSIVDDETRERVRQLMIEATTLHLYDKCVALVKAYGSPCVLPDGITIRQHKGRHIADSYVEVVVEPSLAEQLDFSTMDLRSRKGGGFNLTGASLEQLLQPRVVFRARATSYIEAYVPGEWTDKLVHPDELREQMAQRQKQRLRGRWGL